MGCELLKGFRMLDLSDEKGAMCGKMFADMGADVIKVEPPGGCATRRIPPFLDDHPSLDTSLYFLAYQAGKRSITLNLECADGRRLLTELAGKADFLVESFPVDYLESLGLGYQTLSSVNPRLIHTSITPFGDRGPGRNYSAADITIWAAGGNMYLMGEEGRPPLQISLPQAGLHAGAEAAAAAMIAHYARQSSGQGQHIVVDMQACVVWTLMNAQAFPIMHGGSMARNGVFSGALRLKRKMVFRCADGHISMLVTGGTAAPSIKALADWMDEKGFAADWMKRQNWSSWAPGVISRASDYEIEQVHDIEDRVERFFMTMTKREIYAGGLKRRILLSPVQTVAEIAADDQLEAREFFVPVPHPNLGGANLTFPGPFAKLSATPLAPPTPAPKLGEHNQEIYGGLMGLTARDLAMLRAVDAI
ncbi:MAG TPA: CoA transferase [Candidatus Binataceae bacterium]|jgi:benzylsuccinate CoA-transferase BbsE subunit|nr:CoA transferase [Candidatus Binataceae bacterium]